MTSPKKKILPGLGERDNSLPPVYHSTLVHQGKYSFMEDAIKSFAINYLIDQILVATQEKLKLYELSSKR